MGAALKRGSRKFCKVSMCEAELGIESYLAENCRLEATLKHRMTDFMVEEIEEKGSVVRFNPNYLEGYFIRIIPHYVKCGKNGLLAG